jgi:hypothetical protein
MDYLPKRVEWMGTVFDSQLEADWAASLRMWGVEYLYHPGRVFLGETVWEPDFQVDAGGRDLLLEVKGEHNHRIEKVDEARQAGFNVIVGRTGWIPAGSVIEHAGAVWVSPERWFMGRTDSWTRFQLAEDAFVGHVVGWSADFAFEHGVDGVRWFKAYGKDDVR